MNSTFLIILTIISILIASYFYLYRDISSSNYANYVNTLVLIGTIIIVIILIHQFKKENESFDNKKEDVQNTYADIEKTFMQNYPYLERLYQQMYPDDEIKLNFNLSSEEELRKRDAMENHMCNIIFYTIQNVIRNDTNNNSSSHHNIWKSWFRSEILRKQWYLMKHNFDQDTINQCNAQITK